MSIGAYLGWVTASLILALILQLLPMPELIAPLRPAWPALVLGFWAYSAPRVSLLLCAWVTGLCMDVLFGAPLGQHALALAVSCFLLIKLSGLARVLRLWQVALALLPAWISYAFLLFWMDGTTGHGADPLERWLPVVTTAILWPLLASLWRQARRRSESH